MVAVSMCGTGNCGVTTSGELGGSGGSAVRSTCRGGSTGPSSTAGRGRRTPGTPGACGLRGGGLGGEAIAPMLTLPALELLDAPGDVALVLRQPTEGSLERRHAVRRAAHLLTRRSQRSGRLREREVEGSDFLDELSDEAGEHVNAATKLLVVERDGPSGGEQLAAHLLEPLDGLHE